MTTSKVTETVEELSPGIQHCPIVAAIQQIGGEWKLIVIRYLWQRPMGFNELLKAVEGLNSKTLSSTLKYLESHGIIARVVENTRPFRVRYSLTEKGRALEEPLRDLQKWGEDWIINGQNQSGQALPNQCVR